MSLESENNTEMLIKKILVLGVVLGLVVIGWGFVNESNAEKRTELSNKIREIEVGSLAAYKKGKSSAEDVLNEFISLTGNNSEASVGLAFALQFNDALIEKSDFNSSAKLMEHMKNNVKDSIARQIVLSRLATSKEETGKVNEAIETLNELLSLKYSVLEDKAYFDLGRLHLKAGNDSKAKDSLNYVVEKSKDSELVKLAKYFLLKIK